MVVQEAIKHLSLEEEGEQVGEEEGKSCNGNEAGGMKNFPVSGHVYTSLPSMKVISVIISYHRRGVVAIVFAYLCSLGAGHCLQV